MRGFVNATKAPTRAPIGSGRWIAGATMRAKT
jgi:hypothetical protein